MSSKKDEKNKQLPPEINTEKLSQDLAELEHKQHIDQIGPAMTDVFLKHAKYTDDKGIIRFKTKFTQAEAEKLSHDIYDALAYHSHRRVFNLNQEQFDELKKFKDANDNPYIDIITRHHYQINRKYLLDSLADDEDNTITHHTLESLLENPVKHHKKLLVQGLIEKEGLEDPKHMAVVKKAIDKIVEKYKLNKKKFNTSKINDYETLLSLYVGLSQEHYKKD